MKHTLTEAQCEAILKKHGIITTGYIPKAMLCAALLDAFHVGNNVDVVKMKYKAAISHSSPNP